jgi:hypothetical protein
MTADGRARRRARRHERFFLRRQKQEAFRQAEELPEHVHRISGSSSAVGTSTARSATSGTPKYASA